VGFWTLVAILAGFILFLEVRHRLTRSVTRLSDPARICEGAVVPWMMRGWDGTRVVVFHKPSGIMIQAVKGLKPRRYRLGKVNLRVLKARVPLRQAVKLDLPSSPGQSREEATVRIAVWRRPSPFDVEVIEEVDCGASLSKLQEVSKRMIEQAVQAAQDRTVYVWCEQGWTTFVMGKFDP